MPKGQRDLDKETNWKLGQRGEETRVTKRKGVRPGRRQKMDNGHIQEQEPREGTGQGVGTVGEAGLQGSWGPGLGKRNSQGLQVLGKLCGWGLYLSTVSYRDLKKSVLLL